jgi:hypothetical protein
MSKSKLVGLYMVVTVEGEGTMQGEIISEYKDKVLVRLDGLPGENHSGRVCQFGKHILFDESTTKVYRDGGAWLELQLGLLNAA